MPESTQHKLDRVRPPRVQITYDVETRGSFVKKELPFVVGIMADLSTKGGQMAEDGKSPLPLRDKKYLEIDRDNFNDIMKSLKPTVELNGGATSYTFESLEDFSPIRLLIPANTEVNKVDSADASALGLARADYVRRTRLSDIVAKLDGNVVLQNRFIEALSDANRAASKTQIEGVKSEATARLPQPSTTAAATETPAAETPKTEEKPTKEKGGK
ncbi:MAG TPA: type VI secretion system contractile sheath small subunit [Pyrinomonadaceae bacterium]|nr:type VI secretion system contractile sheath small subunit [Pyrinomonadaceae bacterium]